MIIQHKDRPRYSVYAAIQNIDARIVQAKRAKRDVERELDWLENLRQARADQLAAGTWPDAVVAEYESRTAQEAHQ